MRRPPLNPADAALWEAVAKTIRPIGGGQHRVVRQHTPLHSPKPLISARHVIQPIPLKQAPAQAIGQTLDASWDKRLARGGVAPDRTIDLHGLSLDHAHARVEHTLSLAIAGGARLVLVITGKPAASNPRLPPHRRGVIRASIHDWLIHSRHAPSIAAVRNAHQRHGGAGALYIVLRRSR